MEAIRKLDNGIGKLSKVITAGVMFIQMFIVFCGVIARYFFNNPLTWVDELSCYLLVYITFIGGYVALRENKLASITFIVEKIPFKTRKIIVFVGNLLIMILTFCIGYYGIKLGLSPVVQHQKTPSMQLPMIVFFSFIPISGTLMLINMIVQTYDLIKLQSPKTTNKEESPTW